MTPDDAPFAVGAPVSEGYLDVSDGYRLRWIRAGVHGGMPLIYLHGGPGGAFKQDILSTFDLNSYEVFSFDQRGCGRSTPLAETTHNDTGRCLEDIEALRRFHGVDRWVVAGGSWGSLLALLYAQKHPKRTLGLRIHSTLLGRKIDSWYWWQGSRFIFPEFWENLSEIVLPEERDNLARAYYKLLIDPDPNVHFEAARRLKGFSRSTQTFHRRPWSEIESQLDPVSSLSLARLFTHYTVNGFFISEGQVLREVETLEQFPIEIVHGRYDVVTPLEGSYLLSKSLQHANLAVVNDASHTGLEHAMRYELIAAAERLFDRVKSSTAR